MKRYSFSIVTFGLFFGAFVAHWWFGWNAYLAEHGANAEAGEFLTEILRDTFENWQSEFLQLVWQVAGLSFLLHHGSPQSKDEQERLERKVDEIRQNVRHILTRTHK